MNFRDTCEQFHRYSLVVRSRTTVRRNRNALNVFANASGIRELDQATADVVRNWIFHGRSDRNWSAATCRTYHKSLKVFFDWCVKQKYLTENPALDVELPKIPQKIPNRLSRQEALRLMEIVYNYPYPHRFLRYRNHAVIATFLFAGLRKQELLNLKYSEVDLDNSCIFVRSGKGNKDRIIPICETLAQSLRAYLAERRKLNKTCPEFFVARKKDVGMSLTALRILIDKLSASSGRKFTPHALRHTFATLMLDGGCDLYSLSKMMGHSDLKTTTMYLAASVELLRGQITKHPLDGSPRA